MGTSTGEREQRVSLNGGYQLLREATVTYAMTDHINYPPPEFAAAVTEHFLVKREFIALTVLSWLKEVSILPLP